MKTLEAYGRQLVLDGLTSIAEISQHGERLKSMSITREIVNYAIKAGSSDIHLEEGAPIAIRVNFDIRILDHILRSEDMSRLLKEMLDEQKAHFQKYNDLTLRSAFLVSLGSESMPISPRKGCLTLESCPMMLSGAS